MLADQPRQQTTEHPAAHSLRPPASRRDAGGDVVRLLVGVFFGQSVGGCPPPGTCGVQLHTRLSSASTGQDPRSRRCRTDQHARRSFPRHRSIASVAVPALGSELVPGGGEIGEPSAVASDRCADRVNSRPNARCSYRPNPSLKHASQERQRGFCFVAEPVTWRRLLLFDSAATEQKRETGSASPGDP